MLKKRLILLGLLLVVSIAGQVLLRPCLGESKPAADTPLKTDTSTPWNTNPQKTVDSLGGSLTFKFIMMLVFVAAAGVGVWWFLKKMNTPWLGTKNGQLELIETIHLGPRKAIHIVRAAKKQVLLGSGNDGVRFLCELASNIEPPSDEAKR